MHPSLLSVLCCPQTRLPLELIASETSPNGMVISGALVSRSGLRYPIVRGVPRFVDAELYAASFGYEWSRWPRVQFETENVGKPMANHTTRMWETITDVTEDRVRDKVIAEFGCGPGRFLDVLRRKGGRAVGIDLSLAVEAARDNFADDPNVLIVQGNLLHPPFRDGVFDGGFTIGVLHHMPTPLDGLKALVRTIRPMGWVACSVYPKGEFYDYISVARIRGLHNRLKPILGYRPALVYAYISAYFLAPLMRRLSRNPVLRSLIEYLERNWLVCLHLPDVRWRLLDTFDAITPAIASTHTGDEVGTWMKESGCGSLRTTAWCETSVVGIKQ